MNRRSSVWTDPFLEAAYTKSHVTRNAERRRLNPTRAEAELEKLLNSLNGGVLAGRFEREHVISGKWIVDFFFPEVRLAIEVDGSIHNTEVQRAKDKHKETDCARFDITLMRLRNSEVLGSRNRLIHRLRAAWAEALKRENRVIGTTTLRRPGNCSGGF
jgi:very-short-patch-repair endonuclease